MTILKQLQEYLETTNHTVHATAVPHIHNMSWQWGRLARWKPFLTEKEKKIQAYLDNPMPWGKLHYVLISS